MAEVGALAEEVGAGKGVTHLLHEQALMLSLEFTYGGIVPSVFSSQMTRMVRHWLFDER